MSAITLEAAQAELDKAQANVEQAKAILEQVKAQSRPTVLKLPVATITLQPGERYVGLVLNADGTPSHHLILLGSHPRADMNWQAAKAWAAAVGGELPTRQEQSLLYANCKPHLKPVWHWSGEEHEKDASYAWHCYFSYGCQSTGRKSDEGAAVAVRRLDA